MEPTTVAILFVALTSIPSGIIVGYWLAFQDTLKIIKAQDDLNETTDALLLAYEKELKGTKKW